MSYGDVWKDLLVPEKYKEKYYQNTIDFDKHPKEPSAEQLTILSKARRNTQSPSHRDRMLTFENQTNAITIKNKVMTKQSLGVGEDFEKRLIEVSDHDFNAKRIIKALNIDIQKRI